MLNNLASHSIAGHSDFDRPLEAIEPFGEQHEGDNAKYYFPLKALSLTQTTSHFTQDAHLMSLVSPTTVWLLSAICIEFTLILGALSQPIYSETSNN